MIHDLKIWPEQFELVAHGYKTFELRKNDRDYHVDDVLHLREWNPATETYTERECIRMVTHMLDGMWMDDGYCILSIVDAEQVKRRAVLEWLWWATKAKMAANTAEEADVAQRDCDAAMAELEEMQNKEGDRLMGEHFTARFDEWHQQSKESAKNKVPIGTLGSGMSYALKQSTPKIQTMIVDPKNEYVSFRQPEHGK
jgi:hypothetical protein